MGSRQFNVPPVGFYMGGGIPMSLDKWCNSPTEQDYEGYNRRQGIFHHDVEIYREEWSPGFCENGTGVFSCPPKQNPKYTYRERILLAYSHLSATKVTQILIELSSEWPGYAYDLLLKNCNHLCDSFFFVKIKKIGVQKLPGKEAFGVRNAGLTRWAM